MKKFALLLTVLIGLGLSSCSNLKNLLKVNVDTTFTVDLPVEVAQSNMKSSAGYPFSATTIFNPTDEPDLVDYVETIQDIDITAITATIQSLSETFMLLSATLTVSGADKSVEWTFTNVSISEGSLLELANESGQLTTLSEILSGLGDVTVTFTGLSSLPGISYVLQTVMDATVAAGL